MWAVKNSQKRRSARSEGEKSAGVAARRAGRGRALETFDWDQVGEHGVGVYADSDGS